MNSFQWRRWFLFLIFAVYRRLDTVDGKCFSSLVHLRTLILSKHKYRSVYVYMRYSNSCHEYLASDKNYLKFLSIHSIARGALCSSILNSV